MAKKLYLYDAIGFEEFSSKAIAKWLEENDPNLDEEIELHVNSPGGLVWDGIAIYNLLRLHNVVTVIDGQAASAASWIALAGKPVRMYRNTMFMIHNAWTFAWGDQNDFKKVQENLEFIRELVVNVYEQKTGQNREQLKQWMDDETWFTAEEALEAGFIDEVIDSDSKEAKNDLKQKYYALVKQGEQEMREYLIKLFGLNKDATDEQIQAAAQKAFEAAANVPALQQEIQALKKKKEPGIDNLPESVMQRLSQMDEMIQQQAETISSLQGDLRKKDAQALVNQAVQQGKIFPGQADDYLEAAIKDPAAFAEKVKAMPKLFDPEKGLKLPDEKPETPQSPFQQAVDFLRERESAQAG